MFEKRLKGHHDVGSKFKSKKRPASPQELENFLQTSPKEEEGVIYFHVPYCDKICSFCSMNRSKDDDRLDEYTKFLLQEIEKYAKFPYIKQKKFDSIYFGGGTPTILKNKHLEQILVAINENFNISKTCEFSFESTLHNLSLDKLKLMQSLGVNRYSIGVQTFSTKGRELLNRTGDKEKAVKNLSKIKENFDGLVCIDIIYNYPNQSIKEVLEDAKITKELQIDSASFYSLMFHDGSVLSENVSQDYYSLDTDKSLHHAFLNSMLEDEYEVLEYTKIARKNKDQYKYIRLSHKGADILPLGVGAGGRLGLFDIYKMNEQRHFVMHASEEERNYKKLSSLFQYPQIEICNLHKYLEQNRVDEILNFLKKAEKYGYLSIDKEKIIFTQEGVFWGNTIANSVLEIALKEIE